MIISIWAGQSEDPHVTAMDLARLTMTFSPILPYNTFPSFDSQADTHPRPLKTNGATNNEDDPPFHTDDDALNSY